MQSRQELKHSGWVFSKNWDLAVFLLPLIIGFLFYFSDVAISRTPSKIFILAILFHYLADAGHVLVTGVPVLGDATIRKKLGMKVWLIPILVVFISVSLFMWNPFIFIRVLAFLAAFHIVMQQFGFLRISQGKFKVGERISETKKSGLFETGLFFNLFFFPLYFWLSGNSNIELAWFVHKDLGAPITWAYFGFVHHLHLFLVVFYFGWQLIPLLKKSKVNWGKFLLTSTSWIWFYSGLVLAKNPSLFWATLFLTHGFGYILFVKVYWQQAASRNYQPPSWWKKNNILTTIGYLVAVTILGATWAKSSELTSFYRILIPLSWAPLITHYVLDGLIWKSRFYKGNVNDGRS